MDSQDGQDLEWTLATCHAVTQWSRMKAEARKVRQEQSQLGMDHVCGNTGMKVPHPDSLLGGSNLNRLFDY